LFGYELCQEIVDGRIQRKSIRFFKLLSPCPQFIS